MLASGKISDDNPFKNCLDFYGQEGVADACLTVYFDLVAKYSERLSADEQKEVIRVFLESCQHERQFFQMAVEQEEWPEEVRNV